MPVVGKRLQYLAWTAMLLTAVGVALTALHYAGEGHAEDCTVCRIADHAAATPSVDSTALDPGPGLVAVVNPEPHQPVVSSATRIRVRAPPHRTAVA